MVSQSDFTFQSRIFIKGSLVTKTGMHIGGSSTEMGIGGADSIVVRDPVSNQPYIPGSSLRGKLRSLYEKTNGEMTINLTNGNDNQKTVPITSLSKLGEYLNDRYSLKSAGPSTDPTQVASRLFGLSVDSQPKEGPVPQRLVVRDVKLKNPETLEQASNTDMPMTEVKTEVNINRITSEANPRQIERVPAGAEFDMELILNLYGEDQERDMLDPLFQCMILLQDDYLGGHGSRGYGRVEFKNLKVQKKTLQDYKENNSAQEMQDIVFPEALQS